MLSLAPGLHHGLGVDNYVQVTSPLRRYNDLVTQKQLKNAMVNLESPYSDEEILNVSMSAQKKIRQLHSIENTRKKFTLHLRQLRALATNLLCIPLVD